MAAVARHKVFMFIAATLISGPPHQVGLLVVHLPMVFEHVTASLCPSCLLVHVALLCPMVTLYQCDQQYPLGSKVLRRRDEVDAIGVLVEPGVGEFEPRAEARRVYAIVSAVRLAMIVVIL